MPAPWTPARLATTTGVVLLVALAVPAGAAATTTVSLAADVVTITGDDAPSLIEESYEGYLGRSVLNERSANPIVAGAGCAQLSATSVDCGALGPQVRVVANLGGGDDRFKWIIDQSIEIDGGAGNDVIETGYGADVLRGGDGDDDLNAGRGDDTLDGGAGNDVVDGWDGSDRITGGTGRDVLRGDGATVYAGGADVIDARDGEVDQVDCGQGADSTTLDAGDVTSGCEGEDRGKAPTPDPPGPRPPVVPGAVLKGGTVTAPRLGRLAGGSPVSLRLTAQRTCSARVRLVVTRGEARRTRLGSKALTLGTGGSVALTAGKAASASVRAASRYRSKLRRARRVDATLVATCTGGGQAAATVRVPLRLRR